MYLLIKAAYWFFSRLPLSALQSIGRLTGAVMYYVLRSRREVAYKNCGIIGVENPEKVVKSSFRHTFCAYMESFYSNNVDRKFLDEMVEIEYISGVKPEKTGHFIVSAHFGAWELAANVMTKKLEMTGAVVGRKIKDPKVDEFIMSLRNYTDVKYIQHRGASDEIVKYMDQNLSIGVLLDHSSLEKDSLRVPFFGIVTSFLRGIPLLAARRNYPIVTAFILRKKKGYKLIVYPAIWPDKSLPPKERAHDLALRINHVYEDIIRKYPEQWYLIHKRFKRTADENGKLTVNLYD